MIITREYLRANPSHLFVFGDNLIRTGMGGAAALRNEPNTYGFVTKKLPAGTGDEEYYRPDEYSLVFFNELWLLEREIDRFPQYDKILISKVGAGLANKFQIYEMIIEPGFKRWQTKHRNKIQYLGTTLDHGSTNPTHHPAGCSNRLV